MLEYKNTSLVVSNFLWTEHNTPLEITSTVIPALTGNEAMMKTAHTLEESLQHAQNNHPDLTKIRVKLKVLHIEKRLIADKFKPKITLEYNMIQRGFLTGSESFTSTYLSDNYKFGVGFSFPVFPSR